MRFKRLLLHDPDLGGTQSSGPLSGEGRIENASSWPEGWEMSLPLYDARTWRVLSYLPLPLGDGGVEAGLQLA